jgi:ABC-type thiamine transport system ATPase subunit
VLVVTHDPDDVRALADQVVCFEPGRVTGVVAVSDWQP